MNISNLLIRAENLFQTQSESEIKSRIQFPFINFVSNASKYLAEGRFPIGLFAGFRKVIR